MKNAAGNLISESEGEKTQWIDWLRKYELTSLFGIKDGKADVFDQITWQPDQADRLAAWEFYTELRTRITTQPLDFRSGDEATALESVYRLFELSRSIIGKNPGCNHFATLTVRTLNLHVRPFTTKWHRRKVDGQLDSADVRYEFRRELAQLQPLLRELTYLTGLIAADYAQIAAQERKPYVSDTSTDPHLWDPLPFGVVAGTNDGSAWKDINASEAKEILARRSYYGLTGRDVATDAVGLALSGGGIRSATFALGVVQTLARRGVLRDVDYLSTVSGGGYLGSFISSFLNDPLDSVSLRVESAALPFGAGEEQEADGVRNLRNHSKYLSEGGLKTLAAIVAMAVYGVIVSILLISPFLLSAVLIVQVFFGAPFRSPQSSTFFPGIASLVLLTGAGFLLPILQTYVKNPRLRELWGNACVGLAVVSIVLLILGTLPWISREIPDIRGASEILGASIALPIVLGAIGLWLGVDKSPGRIVLSLLTVTGPLFLLCAFLWLCEIFVVAPPIPRPDIVLPGLTALAWIYASFFLNINFASPHTFYRNRLARTYLTRQLADSPAVHFVDPQPLSAMNSVPKGPYHLINAALNIPACKDPNLRGRNTDFFVFSKCYCGSPMIRYRPTTEWEALDKHLDLGTAVAISGAAAAPHMGTLTSLRFTFLLAILNVRLGYWAKCRQGILGAWSASLPPTGWAYYFRELTGLMTEKTRFVNLSDGGHIENLGVYELLRRRCKFVIAVDGEADPKRSFGGLLTLTQLAKIDLNVRIEPDLGDLRIDRDGRGRAHFALARIHYADGQQGLLLYIKTSLTGDEPEFLKKYHADNPDFPHQSTAQQLFSESQFEAYRALGEHVARNLFGGQLLEEWRESWGAREWFKQLAQKLLPPLAPR